MSAVLTASPVARSAGSTRAGTPGGAGGSVGLPWPARAYLWAVALAAGLSLSAWTWAGVRHGGRAPGADPTAVGAMPDSGPELLLFLLLLGVAVLAQQQALELGGPRQRKVNVAIGAYFGGLLMFGPAPAVALAGAGQLLGQGLLFLRRDPQTGRRRRAASGLLFNTGQLMLATAAGGAVFAATAPRWAGDPLQRPESLWALPLAAGAMYLVNSLAVAVMVALQLGRSPAAIWSSGRDFDLLQFAAPFVGGLAIALAAGRHVWGPVLLVAGLAVTHLALRQTLRLAAGERAAAAAAALAAAEAARSRWDFFRTAAHELRTPLTSLRGYTRILLSQLERGQAPDPQGARRALRVIDEQSDRLERLAAQLLDASRLHQGKLTLERRPVDLALLATRLAGEARLRTRHRIDLVAPAPVWADVDAARLEQVLQDLLDLVLRYVLDGDTLRVEVARTAPGSATLTVGAGGATLDPECRPYRHQLADRFSRSGSEQRPAGLSLGLYVSRLLVEAHGGAIEVLETPGGDGSHFVLTLPAVSPPAQPPLPVSPPGSRPAPA